MSAGFCCLNLRRDVGFNLRPVLNVSVCVSARKISKQSGRWPWTRSEAESSAAFSHQGISQNSFFFQPCCLFQSRLSCLSAEASPFPPPLQTGSVGLSLLCPDYGSFPSYGETPSQRRSAVRAGQQQERETQMWVCFSCSLLKHKESSAETHRITQKLLLFSCLPAVWSGQRRKDFQSRASSGL